MADVDTPEDLTALLPDEAGTPFLSIVIPTFNEVENIPKIYAAVKAEFDKLGIYEYEHLFIDNDSRDGTRDVLLELAGRDKGVKLIFNSRNFGEPLGLSGPPRIVQLGVRFGF